MKLSEFISNTSIPASLVRGVVRQLGGWQVFKERARDVAYNGAGGGYNGFIYYTETCAFARRHKPALLAYLREQAGEFGEKSPAAFLAARQGNDWHDVGDIERALYTGKGDASTQVNNALAWYALEEVSRAYADQME